MCNGHQLIKTYGAKTKNVTFYCLECEAEKERLKKIIDAQIKFTHVTKML